MVHQIDLFHLVGLVAPLKERRKDGSLVKFYQDIDRLIDFFSHMINLVINLANRLPSAISTGQATKAT